MNKPILDLLTAAFQDQDKYQPYLKDLAIPPHPSTMEQPELKNQTIRQKLGNKVKLSKEEMSEYKSFLSQRQAHNQLKKECYSLWCDMLYKLSIANHFRDEVRLIYWFLKKRGKIVYDDHVAHLKQFDYVKINTLDFFKHTICEISFTIVVNNFGI